VKSSGLSEGRRCSGGGGGGRWRAEDTGSGDVLDVQVAVEVEVMSGRYQ